MISVDEALRRFRSILGIKTKNGRMGTKRTSFDADYHSDYWDREIYKALTENDISTSERTKDYEASKRRKKLEEESR